MNNAYRLIVFDWEGTLADTLAPIVFTLMDEAHQLGLGTVDEKNARNLVTQGLPVMIKKLFPETSFIEQQALLAKVQQALVYRPMEVYLFQGARELMRQVKQSGIHLAIATNKGSQSLQKALQASCLEEYFPVTRSPGRVPAKPCPQMLEEIMTHFNVLSQETLMVGDSVTDMEMAISIGVTAIGMNLYGESEQEELLLKAGAVQVLDQYSQLADFLQLKI